MGLNVDNSLLLTEMRDLMKEQNTLLKKILAVSTLNKNTAVGPVTVINNTTPADPVGKEPTKPANALSDALKKGKK